MRGQEKKKYYLLQLQEIENIVKDGKRPSLLMHTCCAVCACYPALYLAEYFDLTLYYNNDNIYPFKEYDRRYNELVRLIDDYNNEHNTNIKIIKTEFDGKNYLEKLKPLKDEPERGARCKLCYSLRMKQALDYASENHFDYFTTVMTVSRQKDSEVLNQIGEKLVSNYPNIKYFYSDFKKNGGLQKGSIIANEKNLYRQQYCGCYYSYLDYLQRERRKQMNELKELAKKYYLENNYNCAETVFLAANEFYKLNLSNDDMKLLSGFGGGMMSGNICGALLASISMISYKYVKTKSHDDKAFVSEIINKELKAFDERFKALRCDEIKPANFKEGIRCLTTVEDALEILADVINNIEESLNGEE